ncbi:MAG: urea transporter [Myxococcales bacterium]|nr:urea transporter [Myxococcales bacterium]
MAALSVLDEALLRSYAQILFARSRVVGLLLLAATALSPRLFAAALLAGLCANVTALGLALREDLVRSGLFGYNALLVALGWAALLEPSLLSVALLCVAVLASVFITAAVHSALGAIFNLPALTVPFLVVFPLLLATAKALGVPAAQLAASASSLSTASPLAALLPAPLVLFLRSLGAIFFLPRVEAGLLVLLAIAVNSRISLLLALVGFAVAQVICAELSVVAHPLLPLVLGYNCLLVAQALGGVWFVPSLSSFVFAGLGALVAGLLGLGLLPAVSVGGVPLLVVPFNLAVFLLLYAMRQRTRDQHPKSVDFLLGTPEENLSYFRTRLSRFGACYAVRLRAPFLGRWVCTQGVDGDRTHKGAWRHAFDFEVRDDDGALHRGDGRALEDYYCYRLPVLSPADGTVVKVVDGVPDTPPGHVNLEQNWGNAVVIYHAPGLYSLICHFSPGTLEVAEGQPVRAGDRLGLCGSSGRAPRPHIHFQLQATARVGAPTIHAELHDVVAEGDAAPELHSTLVANAGDVLRNLEPEEETERLLRFCYGEAQSFVLRRAAAAAAMREETVTPDIDLYGNLLLRSDSGATLFYDARPERGFTVYDALSARRSVLGLMQVALGRVPFETRANLLWRDVIPLRRLAPWWSQIARDLLSPFRSKDGLEVRYRVERRGARLVVRGESLARRGERPRLESTAVLRDGLGIESLAVTYGGATLRAERVEQRPSSKKDRVHLKQHAAPAGTAPARTTP